jgi:hypothetical protein
LKFIKANENAIFVGYNNRNYDNNITKGIICGMDAKEVNDKLIVERLKGFQINNNFKDIQLYTFDCYKLGNSLKKLESFMQMNIEETQVDFNLNRHLNEEEIERLNSTEEFDEEWEKILFRMCQKETYLSNRAFCVSSLLNKIAEIINNDEQLGEIIESTLEMSAVTNLKAFDTPKKVKASEFPWEAKLWEPVKAELLKHVKVKMTIPKGKPYATIQSVANKGKIACGISYGVRESEAYVWMETYQGEEMKEKILTSISKLPADHPLKGADLGQGKKNKNKWAWSLKQQIDKTDSGIVKWYTDRILAVYTAMEDMEL